MKQLRSSCHIAPVRRETWISKTERQIFYCGYCGKICKAYMQETKYLLLWDECLNKQLNNGGLNGITDLHER
jgi:hypothetical protein